MDAVLAETLEDALPRLGYDRDFFCGDCRYGIVVRWRLPERCPMCGAFSWAPAGSFRRGGALADIDFTTARSAAVPLALAKAAEAPRDKSTLRAA